ncbi:hypothetical protein [Arthrobacter flavus]|uniref:Chain length determinant protein n=2 Tax=Arthrobacter flavus TaxID=95172 RepID=A0ABW4Q8U6_9MICC
MRRHWRVLASVIVIGLLAAASYVGINTAQYSSTSTVFLEPLAGNPYSPATPSSRPEQLAALTTEAGLVYTDAVVDLATGIGTTLGFDLGSTIRDKVVTQVPSNSQVVQITYTENSPELAQAGSQALAEAYLQYRRERATRVVEAQSELSDQQLESISALLNQASEALNAAIAAGNAGEAEALDLEQQVILYANQLAQVRLDQTDAATTSIRPGDIISPAPLPPVRDGVHPLLIGAGILAMAVLLGIALTLIRERTDKRIHDRDDLSAAGVSPFLGAVSRGSGPADESARENYHRLTNSLHQFISLPDGALMVAGVSGMTPAWEVAAGIADTLAEAGAPVTLVLATAEAPHDLDSSAPGFTDLLSGRCQPTEARRIGVRVSENVTILGPGTQVERLESLVWDPSLETVFRDLCSTGLVLVVGPSVNTALGGVLARESAAILLVVEEDRSTLAEVLVARETLDQDRTTIVGGVLLTRERGKHRSSVNGSIFNLWGHKSDTPPHPEQTEAAAQHSSHT